MTSLTETLTAYGQAWHENDAGKRMTLLDTAWAEDGIYQDPSADVRGRQALCDHIGGVHHSFPGARVEITSGADMHHGKIRFFWRMVLEDGSVAIEGTDFGEVAPDGRLSTIIGFFGTPPAL